MVSRVPPPQDGSRPPTSSIVAVLLVVAVAIGIWLLNGRDPGSPTGVGPGYTTIGADDPASAPSDPLDPGEDGSVETGPAGPDQSVDPLSGLPVVDLVDLPVETAETLDLIDVGGPFPYPDRDGSTFGNYEGLLPDEARGYYAEYTVPTPGEADRGARRIVAGDEGELYWTEDHYESFERIRR